MIIFPNINLETFMLYRLLAARGSVGWSDPLGIPASINAFDARNVSAARA